MCLPLLTLNLLLESDLHLSWLLYPQFQTITGGPGQGEAELAAWGWMGGSRLGLRPPQGAVSDTPPAPGRQVDHARTAPPHPPSPRSFIFLS